jgi:hypothetical protein
LILRNGGAALIFVTLLIGAHVLQTTSGYGASAALSLLIGAALGVVFERGRFCFFCIFRDFIEHRNARPLYAILTALAVSGIGYAVVFGAFLPIRSAVGSPPMPISVRSAWRWSSPVCCSAWGWRSPAPVSVVICTAWEKDRGMRRWRSSAH